jgi:hypothetical protein
MTLATNITLVTNSGNQIDETFPIAGQDNNTQGFRDNFSNAQAGLVAAGSALAEINSTTPKLNSTDNDFTDLGTIKNALFVAKKEKSTSISLPGANNKIQVVATDYVKINVTASTTGVVIDGWPTQVGDDFGQKYRKVRLEFYASGSAKTVKFGTDASYTKIKYSDLSVFNPSTTGLEIGEDSVIIDAWVSDYTTNAPAGKTIYLQYVGTFVEAP